MNPPCAARLNEGGWAWLDDPANGGWWNGTNGYRPYRYRYNADANDARYIRDDIYLPWLSHQWYNWESTLFARNNRATAADCSGSVAIQAQYPVAALGSLLNNNLSDGAMKYTALENKSASALGLPGEEGSTE